ncbi:FecR family protein [Fodinibius saliphilus]|uniref:FecR family protein n=1 Tax=Fodinibius saliphilus TaxID=1920650 RepID=UPI001486E537|nr:FecR domain-containing protein [Fodinibius saliphilus]
MSKKLSELLLDDSFIRFLKGTASENEEAQWSEWMQEKAEYAELVKQGRELLKDGVETVSAPNAEPELQKLMARIESEKYFKPLNAIRKQHKKVVWATMAAAAGILLLVGFIGRQAFFQNDGTENSQASSIAYRTLTTEYGERTAVHYSDGSEIVMNAHSTMRMPENVKGSNAVEVWLEGEAFFNITRKSDSNSRTFIVHTPDGDVSVLGTEFAVNTSGEQTRVVLAEGRVRLENKGAPDKDAIQYEMEPGELALLAKGMDKIEVSNVNPKVYTSWSTDSLVLDNTPFSELIKRIEFTYDVKVKVKQKHLLTEKLTGKFRNLDLNHLIEGISKTMNVKIIKRNKTLFVEKK